MSDFKNINVTYVYVRDYEAGKKFYRELLGWPVAGSNDQVQWEEYGVEGATHFAINGWDRAEPMPVSGATIVFSVDDAARTTADLRRRGVKCDDVFTIPNVVTYGSFYDPDGNRVQFASRAPEA